MLFSRVHFHLPRHEYAKFKDKCDFFDIPPKDIVTKMILLFNDGKLDDILDVPELPEITRTDVDESVRSKLRGLGR